MESILISSDRKRFLPIVYVFGNKCQSGIDRNETL